MPVVGQTTWRVDSAMTTWPLRQALERDRIVTPPGVVRAMQTRDLAQTLKRDAPGIPVFADSLVAYYVDLYGERHRDQFRAMLAMADHYRPLIEATGGRLFPGSQVDPQVRWGLGEGCLVCVCMPVPVGVVRFLCCLHQPACWDAPCPPWPPQQPASRATLNNVCFVPIPPAQVVAAAVGWANQTGGFDLIVDDASHDPGNRADGDWNECGVGCAPHRGNVQ